MPGRSAAVASRIAILVMAVYSILNESSAIPILQSVVLSITASAPGLSCQRRYPCTQKCTSVAFFSEQPTSSSRTSSKRVSDILETPAQVLTFDPIGRTGLVEKAIHLLVLGLALVMACAAQSSAGAGLSQTTVPSPSPPAARPVEPASQERI